MAKSPAFSMYVKDWLGSESIALMPPEAEGLYARLLMLSWDNEGLPVDAEAVKALVPAKYHKCWKKAWPPVRKKFMERGGRLVNLRQEQERAKQAERSERMSRAGKQSVRQRKEEMFCYAAQRPSDGIIKIGASHDPESRCESLRLQLLAYGVGGFTLERDSQVDLAASRVGTEWFAPTAEVLQWIEQHLNIRSRAVGVDVPAHNNTAVGVPENVASASAVASATPFEKPRLLNPEQGERVDFAKVPQGDRAKVLKALS